MGGLGRIEERVTLTKLAYRWSPKKTIRGIPTGVLRLSSREERVTIFGKVEAALEWKTFV